jgi:hypothetical protein
MSLAVSLSRSKGPALAVTCLLGGLLLADLLASAVFGWDAYRDVAQESQTYSRLELASGKAIALASAARRGQRVALVYGMSTAEQGIQLRSLEKLDTSLRWAKITGEHASFVNLLEVARRVERSGVPAARTLLGVHYGMLAGANRLPMTRSQQLGRVMSRADKLNLLGEASRALTLSWLGKNREATANAVETRLGAMREHLLGSFGQSPDAIYPRVADPFKDIVNSRTTRQREAWQGRVDLVKKRGWGRPESYSASSEQARALTELVRLLGRRPGLVIVLLPERSVLRELIPESAAAAALRGAVEAAGVSIAPPIVDLRAALPDTEFVDEAHPTGAGSARLAVALNAALRATPGAWPAVSP